MYEVDNVNLRRRFEARKLAIARETAGLDSRLAEPYTLFHGTRKDIAYYIASNGFDVNAADPMSMFGKGLCIGS